MSTCKISELSPNLDLEKNTTFDHKNSKTKIEDVLLSPIFLFLFDGLQFESLFCF